MKIIQIIMEHLNMIIFFKSKISCIV